MRVAGTLGGTKVLRTNDIREVKKWAESHGARAQERDAETLRLLFNRDPLEYIDVSKHQAEIRCHDTLEIKREKWITINEDRWDEWKQEHPNGNPEQHEYEETTPKQSGIHAISYMQRGFDEGIVFQSNRETSESDVKVVRLQVIA